MGNTSSRRSPATTDAPTTPVTGIPVADATVPTAPPADPPKVDTDTATATDGPRKLDVCFTMDCTGSMGAYIRAAKESIGLIASRLAETEGYDVRFGLCAYRDHPPQDMTFVTRSFGFSADVSRMRANLSTLSAQGGGDGPEAVSAALQATLDADWRADATKVAVLIADAPPHGLGERGDGFPNGIGPDPLHVLDAMSARGICVYSVGCQPALSRYRFATDFFIAAAERTNGQAVALGSASALADVILGGAIEEMDLEKLTNDVQQQVQQLRKEEPELDDGEYVKRVWGSMASKGQRTRQLNAKNLFSRNSALVSNAGSLGEAQAALRAAAPAPSDRRRELDEYDPTIEDHEELCDDKFDEDGSSDDDLEEGLAWRSSSGDISLSGSTCALHSLPEARARGGAKTFSLKKTKKGKAPVARSKYTRPRAVPLRGAADESHDGIDPTIEEDTISYAQVERMFNRGKKVGKW